MTRKNSLYVLSTDATVAGRTDCTEHVSNDATALSEYFFDPRSRGFGGKAGWSNALASFFSY